MISQVENSDYWLTTGAVLARYSSSVGTLLVHYGRGTDYYYWQKPTNEVCQPSGEYWRGAGCIQNPNTGCKPISKSHRQLALYWYYFHNFSLMYF